MKASLTAVARHFTFVRETEGANRLVHARRLSHRALQIPSSVEPVMQDVRLPAESFGPSDNRVGDAVERNQPSRAGVRHLRRPIGPTTVARSVRSIVIDSVNRMATRRPRSHVGKEVLKRSHPALGNRDAAAAVIVVLRGVRIQAPVFHRAPGFVFGRVRASVPAMRRTGSFAVQAAAGLAISLAEIRRRGDRHAAAVASAYPFSIPCVTLGGQPSVPFAADVSYLPGHLVHFLTV